MEASANMSSRLEARAATYGLLARLVGGEVDEALLAALRGAQWAEDGQDACGRGEALVAGYFRLRKDAPAKDVLTELAVDFARLFVVRARSAKKAAYPFESVYTSEEAQVMGAARDEVRRFYAAQGLERDGAWAGNVAEDHIALELEFMQRLCLRAKHGLEAGDLDGVRGAIEAQGAFHARHLANWVGRFAHVMCECAQTDFYRGVALYLDGWVAQDRALIEETLAALA